MTSREVASVVGSDGKNLGRVDVGFETDDRDGVADCMENGGGVDAVSVRCPIDFHISIS